MKTTAFIAFLLGWAGVAAAQFDHDVRGYTRKDGTYVAPHRQTNPDNSLRNNYGYPGNFNPNSGKITPGDPYTYERQHQPQQNNPSDLFRPRDR